MLAAAPTPSAARGPAAPATAGRMVEVFASPTGATNSDLAFWGDYAYAGNYSGFRIFGISGPTPVLVRDFACFGPQNDVSVWDRDGDGRADLLLASIDRTLTGPTCGVTATAHDDPAGWEGIRIFDISDPSNPAQIGAVYQDCGSHTHTVIPQPGRLLVLNASYPLRPGPTCGPVNGPAAGRDSLHGVIQVIEVPLADPAAAAESGELPINYPGDPDNVFDPAQHEFECFNPLRAATTSRCSWSCGWRPAPVPSRPSCGGSTPRRCSPTPPEQCGCSTTPPTPTAWVVATPPSTSGTRPRSRGTARSSTSARSPSATAARPRRRSPSRKPRWSATPAYTHFLDVASGQRLSTFMIQRPEPDTYCSTDQGNVVPTPGRYLLVQAWYMGGVDIIDFTSVRTPREIAFHDAPPAGAQGSDNWSHYWYERNPTPGAALRTYAQDGVYNPPTGRGFQTFDTGLGFGRRAGLEHLNPQTQERVIR